jgi:hypothetical protein
MSNDSFKVKNSLNIRPTSESTNSAGDVRVASTDSNRLKYNDGTAEKYVQTSGAILSPDKAIKTDVNGDFADSTVSSTQLEYLANVTSDVQTQINGKQATGNYVTALTGDVVASGPGSATATIQPGAVNNSKISASAAIDRSKIAAGTASRVVVNDVATGALSEATYASVASSMGAVTGVGTLDSEGTPSSNALTVSGTNVIAQSASTTAPGVVNTTTQIFAGAKTFNTSIATPIVTSTGTNPAASGTVRLANGEVVSWRNAGNSSDISFGLNASDQMSVQADLNVNGHNIINTGTLTLPTSTDTLVGRATSDSLTNKTIGSSLTNSLANSLSFKMLSSTPATNPSLNTLAFYPKADGNFYSKNSSGIEKPVGSGGGGSKNYLSNITTSLSGGTPNPGNGDLEFGTTAGWSLGTVSLTNNLPSGVPTFGSGFSVNLSMAVVSSGQIAQNFSLSVVSSAATVAGNLLASDAFYLDKEDQTKRLSISFSYLAQTNPTNANWSGTSANSFGVAVYDVTNSAWIIPDKPFNLIQSSGVGQYSGSIQVPSNTSQFRLVVYNANATSGAVTVYFDDFVVGPQAANSAIGPVVSASYFLTSNQSLVLNDNQITGFTKVFDTTASFSSNAFVAPVTGEYQLNMTGAANGNIAVGYKINAGTTILMGATSTRSAGSDILNLNAYDSVTLYANSAGAATLTSGRSSTFFSISLIQSAGVGPAGQVVSSKLNTLSSTSITANTALTFTNTEFDLTASLSSGNKYTCSYTGPYLITFAAYATSSGGDTFYVAKNGSFSWSASNDLGLASSSSSGNGSTILLCNAGDTLQIAAAGAVTMGSTNANATFTLLQGPSARTASPTVAASYWVSANFAASTTVPINFDSKEFDYTNSVTTSATAWKFTAPVSGLYQVSVFGGASGALTLSVYKGGTIYKPITDSTASAYGGGAVLIKLLANEFIDIRPNASNTIVGGALNGISTANVSIQKVG